MTPLAELRRLAEAADRELPPDGYAHRQFRMAASPASILRLLDLLAAHERVAEVTTKLADEFGCSLQSLQRHGPDYTLKNGERMLVASVLEDREGIIMEAQAALVALDALKEKNDAR